MARHRTGPLAPPSRVLVVEDDHSLRDAISVVLAEQGFDVVAAPDARAALAAGAADVAVVDIRLPGEDGLWLTRRLSPHTPVLLLTAYDSLEDRLAGFAAGADDYLPKPFAMAELLARLRVLLRRSQPEVSGPMITVGDLQVDLRARRVRRAGHEVALSPTEFTILATLARRPGYTVSRQELSALLWPEEPHSNTLEVHVHSLRRKLERYGPRLIHTTRGLGYVLRP